MLFFKRTRAQKPQNRRILLSTFQKSLNEFLFWLQLILAIFFSVPQILKMFQSPQGVTTAYFICSLAFTGVNCSLAWRAWRSAPNRGTCQSFVIYAVWVTFTIITVISALINVPWRNWDTKFLIIVGVLVGTLLTITNKIWRRGYSDPIVRGVVALLCRTVPQFYLAWTIMMDQGGRGLSGITILTGHVGILVRIAHVMYTARHSGRNRNLYGILIAEVGNEIGWVAVTLAWLLI